ncbi:MAG: response regulator, partial [Candidatus Heimdallarchaeota archaeon]|nr:response regulator [Candidatus Heimdallarchaeota archaeon]
MIAGINRLDNTDHTINEVVKKPVILVVDDQPENIDVLSNILRDAYKVKAAINGEQALQIIQEKQAPDLILLDVMMPGIDGYEVCKKLKDNARSKSIPVIFVSALQNISDRVTAFAVGGVDYITKPVQSEEVLARVRAHVQIKMMQEQLEQSNEELEIRVKQRTLEVEAAYSELHESYRQILESEAKYRSLMDAAPDAVILADDGGHIEMVNQEASR